MTYAGAVIDGFRGLNLVDPMDVAANEAVSLLDVDFDRRGRVRSRTGSAQFSTTGASAVTNYAHLVPIEAELVLIGSAGGTTYVDSMATSGAITNKGSFASVNPVTATASIGTPTASYVFMASGGTQIREYNANAGTVAAGSGKPYYVAATPVDNRLAQARYDAAADSPTGANGTASTVFFSNPGTPDTYDANNYIHLHPGDGEGIMGMVSWRELLFVFKRTSIFVFTGTSTDATGNPVFNYRRISIPSPLRSTVGSYQVCAGTDGVYFVTTGGIYHTNGGEPKRISRRIDPLFDGSADDSISLSVGRALGWAGERLYFRYTNDNSATRLLVWDSLSDDWMLWSTTSGSAVPVEWAPGTTDFIYFPVGAEVHRYEPGLATDDGAALNWHWQAGFTDLGDPEEKVVRETTLWGTGAPTVSVLTDHGTTDPLAAAVTLGTSPAIDEGYHRIAYEGNLFSLKLSGTGSASVNRAVMHIRNRRLAGAKS